jgi:hypothetical protein
MLSTQKWTFRDSKLLNTYTAHIIGMYFNTLVLLLMYEI